MGGGGKYFLSGLSFHFFWKISLKNNLLERLWGNRKNDQAQGILAKLRLEPAVFLFFTCFGLFFASSQQLYIEKACKVYSLFIIRCMREKMSDTLAKKTDHNKINWTTTRWTWATMLLFATTLKIFPMFKLRLKSWLQVFRWEKEKEQT